jgi:hypothetical protein
MSEDIFQKGKLAVLNPAEYWDEIQILQERDAIMTDRIEKLEEALRVIVDIHPFKDPEGDVSIKSLVDLVFSINMTARKALEGEK